MSALAEKFHNIRDIWTHSSHEKSGPFFMFGPADLRSQGLLQCPFFVCAKFSIIDVYHGFLNENTTSILVLYSLTLRVGETSDFSQGTSNSNMSSIKLATYIASHGIFWVP